MRYNGKSGKKQFCGENPGDLRYFMPLSAVKKGENRDNHQFLSF
jgi:hypothetical protein